MCQSADVPVSQYHRHGAGAVVMSRDGLVVPQPDGVFPDRVGEGLLLQAIILFFYRF